MEKIDLSFFSNSIILLAIIIALTGFKVFSCKPFKEDGEEFNLKKLLLGLAANFGILVILSFVYFVGAYFGADLAVIQIGEETYTVQAALNVLIILAVGVYGLKLFKNATEFFGLNKETSKLETTVISPFASVVDYNVETGEYEEKIDEIEKG